MLGPRQPQWLVSNSSCYAVSDTFILLVHDPKQGSVTDSMVNTNSTYFSWKNRSFSVFHIIFVGTMLNICVVFAFLFWKLGENWFFGVEGRAKSGFNTRWFQWKSTKSVQRTRESLIFFLRETFPPWLHSSNFPRMRCFVAVENWKMVKSSWCWCYVSVCF